MVHQADINQGIVYQVTQFLGSELANKYLKTIEVRTFKLEIGNILLEKFKYEDLNFKIILEN